MKKSTKGLIAVLVCLGVGITVWFLLVRGCQPALPNENSTPGTTAPSSGSLPGTFSEISESSGESVPSQTVLPPQSSNTAASDTIPSDTIPSDTIPSGTAPEATEPATSAPPSGTEPEPTVHSHTYRWTTTQKPGCESTGVKEGVCACGDSKTETIGATGAFPGQGPGDGGGRDLRRHGDHALYLL